MGLGEYPNKAPSHPVTLRCAGAELGLAASRWTALGYGAKVSDFGSKI
jgi:hypothetical protein